MTQPFIFQVHGDPAPQGSKRHVGRGVMVESSKRVKPWRADVREACLSAVERTGWEIPPAGVGLHVRVLFWFPRPASHWLKSGNLKAGAPKYPFSKGDIDKLLRSTYDAMTGIVFLDDRYIVDAHANKEYLARPDQPGVTNISVWRTT